MKKSEKNVENTVKGVRTSVHKRKHHTRQKAIQFAAEEAAKGEILLTESGGFLEPDDGETSLQFNQTDIKANVDIASAAKSFELKLENFGPYRCRYTRNGRHLLLGGKIGHVAAMDWVTKKLHCELNVMESVHDVCWLHLETMFAVAQKQWVYIYDHQGIELHCVKRLNRVSKMEFLPYHFLLATAGETGYLSWLDISIGEIAGQFNTRLGPLNLLSQNPYNACLCVGHAKGVVSMWSPTVREPLVKILCHKAPMTALHVDPRGQHLVTAAVDRTVKVWDVRKLVGPLQSYHFNSVVGNVAFSQKDLLAISMGNVVEIFNDCIYNTQKKPYLRHRFSSHISNINFVPYEDVLGVGVKHGFASLLVPGCGEPNFDAHEANPYQTKTQRREAEVKALLEKIQPDLITLDPTKIAQVDTVKLRDKIEAKKKLLHVKAPKISYEGKNKMKGRGGVAKMARNKKIVNELAKKEFVKKVKALKESGGKNKILKATKPASALDRFLPKK
ncbi:WD repeat-containing protein 46 [Onthophagus taurus]|uniref:WD repeat-containing protein 46 n=1 Tax=Onthophagus taurus TaxID=166361 RepID=UPI0039BE5A2D